MNARCSFATKIGAAFLACILTNWLLPTISNPAQAAEAAINADGTVDMSVHFSYAPSENDIERTKASFRWASRLFCDMTEEQMLFGDISLHAGGPSEPVSDIWIMPTGAIHRRSNTGFLPDPESRIYLASDSGFRVTAHEIAHGVFRFGDLYDEQSRMGRFYGIGHACGPGRCTLLGNLCLDHGHCRRGERCDAGEHGVAGGTCSITRAQSCSDDIACPSGETCVFEATSDTVNSLMGPGCDALCVDDASGERTGYKCPYGDYACPDHDGDGDPDCGCPAGEHCESPQRCSELLTAEYFDTLKGNNQQCPRPASGTIYRLAGYMGEARAVETTAGLPADRNPTYAELDAYASVGPLTRTFVDSAGVRARTDQDSNRWLRLYTRHDAKTASESTWVHLFVIDSKHLQGGTPGEPVVLLRVLVTFDLTATKDYEALTDLSSASGPFQVHPIKRVCVDTDPGGCVGTPEDPASYTAPVLPIDGLTEVQWGPEADQRAAPALAELTLELDDLVLVPARTWFRLGTFTDILVVDAEGGYRQQTGDCLRSLMRIDDLGIESFPDEAALQAFCGLAYPINTIDSVCARAWNTETWRWESAGPTLSGYRNPNSNRAYDSEWEQVVRMPTLADYAPDFHATPYMPGSIVADNAGCESLVDANTHFDEHVTGVDDLILVLDTSRSMAEDRTSTGVTKSRLEWAKAAARTQAALVATHNALVSAGLAKRRVGVIPFATLADATHVFSYVDTASPDADHTGMVESYLVPVIDVESGDPVPDGFFDIADYEAAFADLEPEGTTALYAGLYQAREALLAETDARSRAIVVLSDGFPNTCGLDGDYCGDVAALQEAEDLANEMRSAAPAIQVFAVPLAGGENVEYLAELFEAVEGDVYEAESASDLPIILAEIYARLSGASPVLARTSFRVAPSAIVPYSRTLGDTGEEEPASPPSASFSIPVEAGAESLNIVLATRSTEPETWAIGFDLFAPGSSAPTHSHRDEGLVRRDTGGTYFDIVRLPAPAQGDWTLRLQSANSSEQHGYVLAWIDNAAPDCWAGADTRRLRSLDDSVRIWAHATWNGPLDGVDYHAEIQRPDGSLITAELRPHPDGAGAVLDFDQLNSRGVHRVTVTCEAGPATSWNIGEYIPGIDETQGPSVPPSVPAFRRTASADFLVKIGRAPNLPGGDDADNDLISNEDEGVTCPASGPCAPPPHAPDTDGDGVIDALDTDSDNDDLPDSEEGRGDSDNDGIPDFRDQDADNDGTIDGVDPAPIDPDVGGTSNTCGWARDLLPAAAQYLQASDFERASEAIARAFAIEAQILWRLPFPDPRSRPLSDALAAERIAWQLTQEAAVALTPWARREHTRHAAVLLWHAWLLKGMVCGMLW